VCPLRAHFILKHQDDAADKHDKENDHADPDLAANLPRGAVVVPPVRQRFASATLRFLGGESWVVVTGLRFGGGGFVCGQGRLLCALCVLLFNLRCEEEDKQEKHQRTAENPLGPLEGGGEAKVDGGATEHGEQSGELGVVL